MDRESFGIAVLIVKFLRNQSDGAEDRQLQQWCEKHRLHQEMMESFKDAQGVEKDIRFLSSIDADAAWLKLQERSREKTFKINIRLVASIALTLCIAISIYFYFSPFVQKQNDTGIIADKTKQYKNDVLPGTNQAKLFLANGDVFPLGEEERSYQYDNVVLEDRNGEVVYSSSPRYTSFANKVHSLTVPKSGTYRIVLEDGTKVWVNAFSSIEFPVQFGENERRVAVSGEAFFEVAKDADRPFKVAYKGSLITALGTSFNVNTYNDKLVTTLTEGAIKVNAVGTEKMLSPGQTAEVKEQMLSIKDIGIEKATAWKKGYFYFDGEDASQIMEEIARWYDLQVTYGPGIRNKKYRGGIKRSATLAEVCEMLTLISDMKFEIDGRNLYVKETD
ncbi:FecR domain-containing protein [Olivibacter sp. SDN3]|uniref:FecR family protein n=1 Tax=Olivibacter sp. SDN3 TaxID=2764720 RepID=UPI001651A15B|nr:FecR family protein [Olivibacter sp. SDN3]QNL50762.1 FecR domain-containing protein [Olivibacter sp. SDN3]